MKSHFLVQRAFGAKIPVPPIQAGRVTRGLTTTLTADSAGQLARQLTARLAARLARQSAKNCGRGPLAAFAPALFAGIMLALLLSGCGGCSGNAASTEKKPKNQAETTANEASSKASVTISANTSGQISDQISGTTTGQATAQAAALTKKSASALDAATSDLMDVSVLPVETELSANARNTYAYLLYAKALADDDEAALMAAAPLLKEARAPVKAWLEGGVRLVGRRSPNALYLLEQARIVWPEEISITLLYAEALADQGHTEQSVSLMRDWMRRYPDSLDGRLELALLLVNSRQFQEAESLLNGITAKQRTPLVDYYHGRALIGMQRRSEALPYLQKAIKQMPDFVEALAETAAIYEERGDLREARSIYERLLKQGFARQEVTLRLIKLSLALNQPDKALVYLQRGPSTIQFKLAAASVFVDSRHYLQAESLLKQIAAAGSPPDEVYLLLADLTYLQRHDLKAAFVWLDKIAADGKNAHRAVLQRARLLAEDNKNAEALALITKGRADFPDEIEFGLLEVRLLDRMGKNAESLAAARSAVSARPKHAETVFLLASLLDKNGDKKNALTVMEDILTFDPDNYQALNYVGYSLAEENRDLNRALDLLTKANELAPDQSYIIDSLAWALYRLGKVQEALIQIRRAAKLDEHADAAIWEHYGDIAARAGQKDEARKAYQKALDLKPPNADVLRQRLSTL